MLKKNLVSAVTVAAMGILVSSNASATQLGFYAGIQAGRADNHYTNTGVGLTSSNMDNVGLGGRLYMGYQFNRQVAAELGYSHMGSTDFNQMNNGANLGKIKNRVADLSLKGTIPLDSGFGGYAKVGVSRVRASANDILKTTATQFTSDETKTVGSFGLGLSYDFSPCTTGDLFWTRHVKSGKIENIDLIGVGLAYYFG